MNEKNTKNLRSFSIRFFFISTALIYLVQAESSFYAPTDFCYDPIQTKIELLVSTEIEYDLSFNKLGFSPKQIPDFTDIPIDFSSLHKLALFHYNNYLLHQLSSFKHNFIPKLQLTSILQKHNVWHQSSDEPPVLFG